MSPRKYHLKEAVYEIALPILKGHGFFLKSSHGDHIFCRIRPDRLVEVVAFYVAKYANDFIVDLALVRKGANPLDAFPVTRSRLTDEDRKIGVRDSLGRIGRGKRYFPGRDGYTWASEDDLKEQVQEAARLAMVHGPTYWNKQATRLNRPRRTE